MRFQSPQLRRPGQRVCVGAAASLAGCAKERRLGVCVEGRGLQERQVRSDWYSYHQRTRSW